MTDAHRRRPSTAALEAAATGAPVRALGGLALSVVGLGWTGVVVGAPTGSSRVAGTHAWRRPSGGWRSSSTDVGRSR